jgi:hypothetical protein
MRLQRTPYKEVRLRSACVSELLIKDANYNYLCNLGIGVYAPPLSSRQINHFQFAGARLDTDRRIRSAAMTPAALGRAVLAARSGFQPR